MHIPDGFLDVKTWTATGAVSAAALGYGLKKTREVLTDKQVPLLGAVSAFIFAAQMVNFPIAGGTSGHLIGGVLAAVLFGPWAAVIIMSVILVLQCLIFLDGGLTALGANVLNMAVIAPLSGYYAYSLLKKVLKGRRGETIAVFTASWLSVVLAAAAASLELAVSGTAPLGITLTAMLVWHAIIGVGEGLITAAVVGYLERMGIGAGDSADFEIGGGEAVEK
ncbi:MAG TPA: cobalamin biosynthesis protein CbiM [Peptococcaceae bacterium]|nr:MAG: Cobalamin (Vitamin B12) biosynthesis CbiM protein [Clostridia bacterium 41_269]HBT20922.1 cobalamin biosynthesis protein CbiM [Peptococcaceae bacterium]